MARRSLDRGVRLLAAILVAAAALVCGQVAWKLMTPADVPPAERPPLAAPPPPPPAPPVPVSVSGMLVAIPGLPIDPAILRWTRVVLVSGEQAVGEPVVPSPDGRFHLEGEARLQGLRVRISTELHLTLFDRSLDRSVRDEISLASARTELGQVFLPRAADFGTIVGQVVDVQGRPLVPVSLEMDAVEDTSTPDVSLARLGGVLDHAANAPVLYADGARFHILHVPPGQYWLRTRVDGRWIPPLRVTAGPSETRVTVPESPTRRRVRGTVLDAQSRLPLGGVEITVGTAGWSGAATRDPLRVIGRNPGGAYDLPLPEKLPPEGALLTFSKRGYRAAELTLREDAFAGEPAARRDVELGRE